MLQFLIFVYIYTKTSHIRSSLKIPATQTSERQKKYILIQFDSRWKHSLSHRRFTCRTEEEVSTIKYFLTVSHEYARMSTFHTNHTFAAGYFVTAPIARLFFLTPVQGYGFSLARIPSLFVRFLTWLATQQNTYSFH